MAKRKHFKIETFKCRKEIDKLLSQGFKYEEIQKTVEEMGEEISISSISRYNKSFQVATERIIKLKESMAAYMEATKDKADTDMAEIANSIIMQNIIERLTSADLASEMKDTDINSLVKMTYALEKNAIRRDDLKKKYGKAIKIAFNMLKTEIQKELINYPDILNRLLQISENAESTVEKSLI